MNPVAAKNKKGRQEFFTPKMTLAGLIFLFGFLAAAFFDAWCGIQSRRMGYEIEQARIQQEKLLDYQKKLRIEKARLSSPRALRRIAAQEMDLETPNPEQIVVLP